MKILWITNIVFPEAISKLTGEREFKSSGGWMLGAADALLKNDGVELFVASVSTVVSKLTKVDGDKIVYYLIPYGKGNLKINNEYIPYWQQIKDELSPDIVHIHGTEATHGYAYLKACGNKNVIISIQGIISIIAKYYSLGISYSDIFCNLTFKDILKGGILAEKNDFVRRGYIEMEMIKMVDHIIGRTSWDRANTWAINPDAKYHFCNETLRAEFYDGSLWNYKKCDKHTIFLSQSSYPIKGLHQLLNAMPVILRHYPDTKIRIAGSDITKVKSFGDWLRYSNYGKYVSSLIKKYNLKDKVVFTGNLNAEEMKQEYLKCNVFVCPSTIENSPNSLGEAQILGVPCVASYVGGIPDMMKGNEDNLYRFEEVAMLAQKVCNIFAAEDNQVSMKAEAEKRHDPKINSERLYEIYNSIVNK